MNESHEQHNRILALASEPLKFIHLCWPDMRLSEQQEQVLLSGLENVETFVHAANKTGKTRIAGVAVIWFFFSRTPSRVILSSASELQLRNVLWTENLHLIKTSRLPLPFAVRDLRIHKLDHVYYVETDDILPEEYADLPDELRELFEYHDELREEHRRRKLFGEDWDD